MKFFILFMGFLLAVFFGFSQAVTISVTTPTGPPNPNVIFSVQSGTKGIQLPQMDSTARLSIVLTPPYSNAGIIVFDTTTASPWYNTGSTWRNLGNIGSGGGWSTTGNAGTVDGTNFVGTTDNIPLSFRVNNQLSGRIDPTKETTFFGYQAGMNNAAFGNSAYGYQALISNTSGINNLALGWSALFFNTTGSANTANGVGAIYNNTTGNNNSALGYDALNMNTTGNNNTGLGYFSLGANSTGNNNTANGYFSLFNNISGSNNVAIGSYALSLTTGASDLVAIGDSALFNNTQTRNTAVGSQALFANTSGGDNTAVGYGALENNNTGGENSAFGSLARTGSSGSFNTVIGFSAQSADGITDATAIGSNANVGTSNTIQLGDNNVTAVNSFGTFNTISDGRFKFNIREDVSGLNFILKLRPVTYQLDTRKIANSLVSGNRLASYTNTNYNDLPSMNIRRTGFIAQEVEKAADETGFNFDAVKKPKNEQDHYSLSYEEFVVPLVKAVQEQQRMIDTLGQKVMEEEKVNAAQKKINDDLDKKMARLQQELDEINKQKIK